MDFRDRLADARQRPHAYGLHTFGEVVAFTNGLDAAADWRFLEGFREWLAGKSKNGENISWPLLVIKITYPGQDHTAEIASLHSESAEAVDNFFTEIEEFWKVKSKND